MWGKHLSALILSLFLTTISCTREVEPESPDQTLEGVNRNNIVNISLPISTGNGMETAIVTKAADLDSQLSSVLLLVYEAVDTKQPELNKLVSSKFYTHASTAGDAEGWFPLPEDLTRGSMKLSCPSGDVFIYLIANWNNSFIDFAPGIEESELNNTAVIPQNQRELFATFIPEWNGNVHRVDGLVPMTATVNNEDGLCHISHQGIITYRDRENRLQTIQADTYTPNTSFNFKRLMAKVTMKFRTPAGSNAKFEPMRYVVRNASQYVAPTPYIWPEDIPFFQDLQKKVQDTSPATFQTQSPNEFTIYIPGNLEKARVPLAPGTRWLERERVTKNAKGQNQIYPENSDLAGKFTFANAPEYGTYIEVSGNYEDPENDIISAETRFFIHMGDFSKDINDYDVKRDHHYTYNITVKGVNDIIAESRDNSPLAEADPDKYVEINPSEDGLVYIGGLRAYCDAHYDQVEMKLNRNSFTNDYAIVFTATPFGSMACYYYPKGSLKDGVARTEGEYRFITQRINTREKAIGYMKWVQMKKQTAPGMLTTYPAPGHENELTNIFEALDYAWAHPDENSYYTCFINEFYYTEHPDIDRKGEPVHLRDFVNKGDRSMAIGQNIYISKDGTSVSVDAVYVVYQKAIATFYDLNENSINKFGVETYSETGRFQNYGSPQSQSRWVWDGRSNTEAEIKYENCVNWAKNGWIIQNVNGQEILVDQGMNRLNPGYQEAYLACLTRNRDFNANGIIDIEELRWYNPALRQLIALWIGEPALPRKAALFTGLTSSLKTAHTCEKAIYSSSSGSHRQLWAEQGCSYGDDTKTGGEIKAIRTLGKDIASDDFTFTKPDYFFKYDSQARTIEVFLDEIAMRGYSATELEPHHERSPINRVYRKIQLADHPFVKTATRRCNYYNKDHNYTKLTESNAYNAKTDLKTSASLYPGDKETVLPNGTGAWRLPNQRELALMLLAAGDNFQIKEGLAEDTYNIGHSTDCTWRGIHGNGIIPHNWTEYRHYIIHCRTKFSNSSLDGGSYTEWGFMYNTKQNLIQMMWKADAGEDFGMGTEGRAGYFCVRDVK